MISAPIVGAGLALPSLSTATCRCRQRRDDQAFYKTVWQGLAKFMQARYAQPSALRNDELSSTSGVCS